MAKTKAPLVKRLMEEMGVADLNDFWAAAPTSKTLAAINAQIGAQLGRLEDEHRAMRTDLEQLGKQQAALLTDLEEGSHVDAMWIDHYSKKIVASEAKTSQALSAVRELMHIRAALLAELPPAVVPATES